MATYSFPPGIAYSVSTIGDQGSGLDTETTFAVDVTAQVYSNFAMTIPVTVQDLNGNPTVVRAGASGVFSPFTTTDVPTVYLRWGANLPAQVHHSDQLANALSEVQVMQSIAQDASDRAAASEQRAVAAETRAAAAEAAAIQAAASVGNATAGALRTVSGDTIPVLAVFEDETIPAGTIQRPSILLSLKRAPGA